MHSRYLINAAEYFKAAQEACDPLYREVQLSLALSWFTLARMDEATGHVVATPSVMPAKSAEA